MIFDVIFIYNSIIMVLSVLGAFLASSSHHRHRLMGYIIWIISNGAIAINFYFDSNWPMVATFVLYEVFNVRGVYSNLTRSTENMGL